MKIKNSKLKIQNYGLFLLFSVLYFLFSVFFTGCERGFKGSVEFRGKVYYGTESSDGKVTVLGPLANARVIAVGYSGSETTNAQGKYDLTIKAVRSWRGDPSYETYTLEASGSSAPGVYPQGNYISEQIVVYGRPGDAIDVRDFLLYKHKETQ